MLPVVINAHNSGKKKRHEHVSPNKGFAGRELKTIFKAAVLQFRLALAQTKGIKTILRLRADDTGLLRCAVLT